LFVLASIGGANRLAGDWISSVPGLRNRSAFVRSSLAGRVTRRCKTLFDDPIAKRSVRSQFVQLTFEASDVGPAEGEVFCRNSVGMLSCLAPIGEYSFPFLRSIREAKQTSKHRQFRGCNWHQSTVPFDLFFPVQLIRPVAGDSSGVLILKVDHLTLGERQPPHSIG